MDRDHRYRPPRVVLASRYSFGTHHRHHGPGRLVPGRTLLLEKGYTVHGMVRRSSTERFDRIEHLRDRVTLHQADLLDQRSLVDALRRGQA